MTRESFPDIPPDALRNHASVERVERVWRRLELDMGAAPRARAIAWWWAPVAAAGIFAVGVAVGARVRAPAMELAAVAEPRTALPAPGGGPAAEPAASVEEPLAPPAQKRTRSRRAERVEDGADFYGPTYGDPSGLTASAPAAVVEFAEWEKLAESGDFRAAKAALDRDVGFERATARASASQLLVLADIARASGSREQAMQALRRVLSSYLSAAEAPIAAWTLGNLLEQAGDRSGAADAYATYRRLSPTGDFAEDAAARQVDAALSQGNLELGRRAMEEYAQNFPTGRRLAELRKRLVALEAPAADGSPGPAAEPEDSTEDDSPEPGAEAPATAPAPASER
ncbi:MAG: hypothetical protein EOO73_13895 [Myxococcales bacterium]|nr:MAG: hypothetical protein EOO73_13895 [Myxococcales bacterium]